ncbi:TonB-dependent receptor [Sphingomonas sp. H39-1-10]|uniref:TonB-dependent receptor domain-containing protein n=1 Tax=Sphingomonas pollutisoli TaxID=3030829 RepID=UPI0023B958E8|nr:TonB-dependent receptor [Sphingomonas pollutisoli]MDF0486553.1 TonB-dependent receptor [Sphingomonas pollutisoli]
MATVLAVSGTFHAHGAAAREARYRVTIARGDLAAALETLGAQTGISIGWDGPLPSAAAAAVSGQMTARAALERLLRETGFHAVRAGPTTFRLVPTGPGGAPRTDIPETMPDVIVTARKQPEALSTVAAPVATWVPGADPAPSRNNTHGVAEDVEGMVVTHAGAGHDRAFMRGIADSPFNGFSQATVSVQLNDARITYDAAEPGLSLIDVARVEVLKGPQGPLYGTGSLGGVYRVVTNPPVLGSVAGSAGMGVTAIQHGGVGASSEATFNLPVIDDRAAIRLVGYASVMPGWVNVAGGARGTNRSETYGGRVSVRIAPAAGWMIDVVATEQSVAARDSAYVDVGSRDLTRHVAFLEPRDGRVRVAEGKVTGQIGATQLTLVTGYTRQDQREVYDATASAVALGLPRGASASYQDTRAYSVFDQEVRLAAPSGHSFNWVVGASYLSATTAADGELLQPGRPLRPIFALSRWATEIALFADTSFPLLDRLRASVGARAFRATTEDSRRERRKLEADAKATFGLTPSASLAYRFARDQLVFLRFGSAFRSGGLDSTNTATGRYAADKVRTLELGGRLRVGDRLSIEADLFRSVWTHLQSDYLEPNGLTATHNVGDAVIPGGELAVEWRPITAWHIKSGITWQRPRLDRAMDGKHLIKDARLPVVPDLSARIEVRRDFTAGAWRITPYAAANYVGASRLSFDAGLDRHMPGYGLARAGVAAVSDPLTVRLDIDNLFDARADTFAFGNPFSVRTAAQFTPARPRAVTLSVSHHF